MGFRGHATVKMSAWRKHRCGACGQKFAYRMTREATGRGYGDYENEAIRTAKEHAVGLVRERLQLEFDCLPCVGCGLYQEEMIADMARRGTRSKLRGAILCALGGGFISFVAVVVSAYAAASRNATTAELVLAGVAWLAALACAAGTAFLLLGWHKGRSTFDPYYGQSAAYWMSWAKKKGVMTPEEVHAWNEQHRAEDEADTEAQGDFDFSKPAPPKFRKPAASKPAVAPPAPLPPGTKAAAPPPAPLPGANPAPAPPVVVRPVLPPPPPKNPFDFG